MSNYTITLKRCAEVYSKNEVLNWFKDYDLNNYLSSEQIAEIGSYWNKDFLAQMIFDHYYLREIAFETPEMFRHFSHVKLQEIMGKYLPLIWSASFKYNPLNEDEVKEIETFEKNKTDSRTGSQNQQIKGEGNVKSNGTSETEGNSSSSSNSNSSSLQVNNNTPQGHIVKENILNGNYASSVTANESENAISDSTTSSSSNSLTNNEETKNEETKINNETSEGSQNENYNREKTIQNGKLTKSEKILQFRKTIQYYNLQIIDELNSLFFALY